MRVLTIVGTRPELIRLSIIIRKLDNVCDHKLLFTNQNFDTRLSDLFFSELKIRKADYIFSQQQSLGAFLSNGFAELEKILNEFMPEKIVTLGDTNSGLLSILATKRKIKVIHLEAGNRCYDLDVPEETNRRIIDSHSYYNLPYTDNSYDNLIREGYSKNKTFKIGNPIKEVLDYYSLSIDNSSILGKLTLHHKDYILLTLHRADNVDNPTRTESIFKAINYIAENNKIIYPLHPRSKDRLNANGIELHPNIQIIEPLGFFDFVKLEKYASLVFTDSGTVPEECSLFGVPCIVLRNTTERQELTENGSLILAGTDTPTILRSYHNIKNLFMRWEVLPDYKKDNVSDTVIRLVLGC